MNRSFWLFTRLYCWECNSYLSFFFFFFFITHSWVIVHAVSCLLSENKLHCTNHFCPSGIFEMCKIIRETSRYLRYEQDPSQNKEDILSSIAPSSHSEYSSGSDLTKGFLLASSGSGLLHGAFLQPDLGKQSQYHICSPGTENKLI